MNFREETILKLIASANQARGEKSDDEHIVSYIAMRFSQGESTLLWKIKDNICEALRACTRIITEDVRRATGKLPHTLTYFCCYPYGLDEAEKIHYFYGFPKIEGTSLHGFAVNGTWWVYGEEAEMYKFSESLTQFAYSTP